jgi:FkbM family methyltransferase
MFRQLASGTLDYISRGMSHISLRLHRLGLALNPWRSLNQLDRKLSKLVPALLSNTTFYIEAGANDGISQSNTFFLEKICGASGLLIEASPSLFEKCVENRSRKNIFEHCALVPESYLKDSMRLVYANLMTISEDVSGQTKAFEHASKGLQFMRGVNYSFLAPVATLGMLIERHNIERVDILSLDLEGYEIEALKGANLQSRIIQHILVEHQDLISLTLFLEANGYRYISSLSHHDHLFRLA